MSPLQSARWQTQAGGEQADALASLVGGGQLDLSFLSQTMARVSWRPEGGFREPRTWAIAPLTSAATTADVPVQGRERQSLSGFDRPKLVHKADTLQTDRLRVRLHAGAGKALRLEWSCPQSGDRKSVV